MKNTFLLLAANVCSVACVVGAIVLAFHGIGGSGWFLFVAVLTSYGLKSSD